MTVGKVYNFDIGDEFQYWVRSSSKEGFKIKVLNKWLSINADTIFYTIRTDHYYPKAIIDGKLVFRFYSETFNEFYTNLESLISMDTSGYKISDTCKCFFDTTYISQFLEVNVYEYKYIQKRFEGANWRKIFGEGLGQVEYEIHDPSGGPYEHFYRMRYYKKGNSELGEPDEVYNLTVDNFNKPEIINFYPNPANSLLYFSEGLPDLSKIKITNCLGETILVNESIANNALNVSHMRNGLYFISIEYKGCSYFRKFIKN